MNPLDPLDTSLAFNASASSSGDLFPLPEAAADCGLEKRALENSL